MLGSLLAGGVEITNDAARADAMIVNTCSFIDSAQEESVDTILESSEVREARNRGQGLIVSGCLSQRFRDELPKLFPEVDAFMGIDQVANVGQIVRQALERRAEKIRNPEAAVRRPKSKVVAKLAELEKFRDSSAHEKEESVRGTDKFGKTKVVAGLPSSILPGIGRHCPPGLHPRLRHAAIPPYSAAFRLRENRRGLQSSVQFLYHSQDARLASQPDAERHRGRGEGAAG